MDDRVYKKHVSRISMYTQIFCMPTSTVLVALRQGGLIIPCGFLQIVNSDPPVPSPVIIKMPQVLQNQLIEDWKRITEQGKVRATPRNPKP